MEKRYQVFVSSTFKDLAKERLIAFDSILQAGCFPACMENFPVLTGDSLKYIYKLIDESDFLLLILGGRYGTSRDRSGVSYTHLEARYALKTGKPIIALYPLDWGKLDDKETSAENISKLVDFIDEIKEKFDGAKPWTAETLSNLVYRGVEQAIKDHPEAVGWVRADNADISKSANSISTAVARPQTVKPAVSLENIAKRLQDKIQITVGIIYTQKGHLPKALDKQVEITWEDIFLSFASSLFRTSKDEDACMKLIQQTLEKRISEYMKGQFEAHVNIDSIHLNGLPPVSDIKIELAKNNLVQFTQNGYSCYWYLTPTGETYIKEHLEKKYHPTIK